MGKAKGASVNNAIAIDRKAGEVINPNGLRYTGKEEFVRHKMLDAIGDLALWGAPIIGAYHGYKSGHDMHARLLKALAENRDCWIEIDLDASPAWNIVTRSLEAIRSRVPA